MSTDVESRLLHLSDRKKFLRYYKHMRLTATTTASQRQQKQQQSTMKRRLRTHSQQSRLRSRTHAQFYRVCVRVRVAYSGAKVVSVHFPAAQKKIFFSPCNYFIFSVHRRTTTDIQFKFL